MALPDIESLFPLLKGPAAAVTPTVPTAPTAAETATAPTAPAPPGAPAATTPAPIKATEAAPPVEAVDSESTPSPESTTRLSRAQGCLLGQLAGDALGSLVEFQTAAEIRRRYPDGVSELADGGTFDTLAGQPTDDSEMALMLARSLVRTGRYDPGGAAVAYALWFESSPFDYGSTAARALGPAAAAVARGDSPVQVAEAARSAANRDSQANGALMRVSPLGIYAHALPPAEAAALARDDAALTHPNAVCRDANLAFVLAIAHAVDTGSDPRTTYQFVLDQTAPDGPLPIHLAVRECLLRAADAPPDDYLHQQGWVLIALRNAFWQLLYTPALAEGVCDTVMHGGDTDTNAAIAGALLGAVYGAEAVPDQWRVAVLSCRPERGRPGVRHPRPRPFWPVDALLLAERLAGLGRDACPPRVKPGAN